MKKSAKKLSVILLAALFAFSAFGCKEEGSTSEGGVGSSVESASSSFGAEESTGSGEVETTGTWFLKDGATDYTIVYAEDMPVNQRSTVSELKNLLYEATGIEFPEKTVGEGETFSLSDKYLVIGDNAVQEAAGVTCDKAKLGTNGAYVETKGDSVFLMGGGNYGLLYSVYDFLEKQIGYDYLGIDCLVFDEEACENSKLVSMKQENIPGFQYRYTMTGATQTNMAHTRRLRQMRSYDIYYNTPDFPAVHNSVNLSGGQYMAKNGVNQLCYLEDPEGLAEVVFQNIKAAYLDVDDSLNTVTFTQMDNPHWCNCDKCTAFINAHGGCYAATQIPACNLIQKKINDYTKEHNRGTVNLLFFSYTQTIDAPAITNGDGSFTAYEDLKFEENLGVYFAPIGSDSRSSIQAPINQRFYNSLKKWGLYTDVIHYWIYGSSFQGEMGFFEPVEYLPVIQSSYQEFTKYGSQGMIMNQCDYANGASFKWTNLKLYIESKLQWNPNIDVRPYYDKFFENFYGPAGDTMREYYEAFVSYQKLNGANFTEGSLNGFLAYVKRAYEDILSIRYTDPELYELYYNRINLESLVPKVYLSKMKIWQWDWEYAKEFMFTLKTDFRKLGISHFGEFTTIDAYLATYGF